MREVIKVLPRYRFFCKTDVRSYYDSIDHYTLLMQLHEHIGDRTLIGYLWQFLNRVWSGAGSIKTSREASPEALPCHPCWGPFICGNWIGGWRAWG